MRKFFWTPVIFLSCFLSSMIYADPPAPTPTTGPQYASFYTKKEVSVPPEHAVPFDEQTVLPTCGIQHVPGSGDFFIKEPGIYRVIYSASMKDAGSMVALELNDSIIQGSEMCIGNCKQLSTLGLLIKVCGRSCCDYKLRLVNNYPLSEIGWYSKDICLQACDHRNVTASLEIERIAECCDGCLSNCCKK